MAAIFLEQIHSDARRCIRCRNIYKSHTFFKTYSTDRLSLGRLTGYTTTQFDELNKRLQQSGWEYFIK